MREGSVRLGYVLALPVFTYEEVKICSMGNEIKFLFALIIEILKLRICLIFGALFPKFARCNS